MHISVDQKLQSRQGQFKALIQGSWGSDSFGILETQSTPNESAAQSQPTAWKPGVVGHSALNEVQNVTTAAESVGLHKSTYRDCKEEAKIAA